MPIFMRVLPVGHPGSISKLVKLKTSSCQFHSHVLLQQLAPLSMCTCSTLETFNSSKFILSTQYDSSYLSKSLRHTSNKSLRSCRHHLIHFYCSTVPQPENKTSLLQRFKQMYKDYWYVLVPVHLITSAFWFSSFYYLTKSGVDIASALESIGAGEKLVQKLRSSNSTMGYVAVSYALYKIATPIRYTVTLGGTTLTIKYLRDWGYIKPIPPKDKIREMIHEKKDIFLEKRENLRSQYKEKGFIKKIFSKLGQKGGEKKD